MRLLIYGKETAPDVVGVGKYTGEMASWLASRRHEVMVIAAPPYYPEWRVRNGWSAWWWRQERTDHTTVLRCPLYVPAQPRGGAKRALHAATYAGSSLPVVLWQSLRWRPDVVMAIAPSIACGPGALAAARLCGARTWLHVQDFEVDMAFEMGLFKTSRARRWGVSAEHRLLAGFDTVSTISERMLDRLGQKGVARSRRALFPNWVDCASIHPLEHATDYRVRLDIGPDQLVALYSGNLGEKQGIEELAEVARRLEKLPQIVLVICGDGVAKHRLAAAVNGLANVRMLPLQPVHALNELLNLADIHLLPQRAEAADLVLPSKLTGMLASGRPVVAGAAPDTGLAMAIDVCGIATPPGDPGAMAEAIQMLADDDERRRHLGRACRQRAIERWDKEAILGRFEAQLEELADRSVAPS